MFRVEWKGKGRTKTPLCRLLAGPQNYMNTHFMLIVSDRLFEDDIGPLSLFEENKSIFDIKI